MYSHRKEKAKIDALAKMKPDAEKNTYNRFCKLRV